jgi:hypothetical protein
MRMFKINRQKSFFPLTNSNLQIQDVSTAICAAKIFRMPKKEAPSKDMAKRCGFRSHVGRNREKKGSADWFKMIRFSNINEFTFS